MNKNIKGTIIKGISGFYYVHTSDGIIECHARGKFRKAGITPLVGDNVCIIIDGKTGTIDEISPRKNQLTRPPVANISQVAIVIASEKPKPNLLIIDKFIASVEKLQIKILICINKTDLNDGSELVNIYGKSGFNVIELSATKNKNIDILEGFLTDNITVFAGNSGVGKSSLMNCLIGYNAFETGVVSDRAERGKHTTRHSELVKLTSGGFIIDTPGFSSFDLSDILPENLSSLFREFDEFSEECKYQNCLHISEDGCAVINAVAEKKIFESRHENYKMLIENLKKQKKYN